MKKSPKTQLKKVSLTRAQSQQLEALWNEHARAVHGMLIHTCGSETRAADVLQDLFQRLATHLPALEEVTNPRAFLSVMGRRIAIDHARKEAADRSRHEAIAEAPSETLQPALTTDADLREAIARAFARLPSEQRRVAVQKLLKGKSLEEIGKQEGVSLNTVASRLRYALDKIRTELRPYYEEIIQTSSTMKLSTNDSPQDSELPRIIQPLDPKRVPSVAPGLEGVASLAVEGPSDDVEIAPEEDSLESSIEAELELPEETSEENLEFVTLELTEEPTEEVPVEEIDPLIFTTMMFKGDLEVSEDPAEGTEEELPFDFEDLFVIEDEEVSVEGGEEDGGFIEEVPGDEEFIDPMIFTTFLPLEETETGEAEVLEEELVDPMPEEELNGEIDPSIYYTLMPDLEEEVVAEEQVESVEDDTVVDMELVDPMPEEELIVAFEGVEIDSPIDNNPPLTDVEEEIVEEEPVGCVPESTVVEEELVDPMPGEVVEDGTGEEIVNPTPGEEEGEEGTALDKDSPDPVPREQTFQVMAYGTGNEVFRNNLDKDDSPILGTDPEADENDDPSPQPIRDEPLAAGTDGVEAEPTIADATPERAEATPERETTVTSNEREEVISRVAEVESENASTLVEARNELPEARFAEILPAQQASVAPTFTEVLPLSSSLGSFEIETLSGFESFTSIASNSVVQNESDAPEFVPLAGASSSSTSFEAESTGLTVSDLKVAEAVNAESVASALPNPGVVLGTALVAGTMLHGSKKQTRSK